MTHPLEGIKVMDLSRTLPGPYCTSLLADMGADVIKVEQPNYQEAPDIEKYLAINHVSRNKRSIAINLKTEGGREVLYKLAEKADVFVEGFRPGVTRRLGTDYRTISKINPSIVYCSITGYGQSGPYSKMPGHNINFESIAGATALTRDKKGRSVASGAAVADISGSLHATIGILVALRDRDKTGRGDYIDIALTDCVLPFIGEDLIWQLIVENKKITMMKQTEEILKELGYNEQELNEMRKSGAVWL